MATESGSRSQAIREYLSKNPKAGPKAVVEALKEKGIEVKVGLVSNVKHRMMARKSRRRVAAQKRAVAKPEMTGTEAIRAYMKEHPKAGPKEIHAALRQQGFKVSASLVNAVKYRKRKRRAPVVRTAVRKTSANGAVTVEQLIDLKRFADSFGGVEQVRRGLETLARFA